MRLSFLLGAAMVALAGPAWAGDPEVTLVLQNHRFTPSQIEAPAGQRIRVRLINRDGALEEFDSDDLGVERDVTPHGETTFTVGPLKPGIYGFTGELHAATATGAFHVGAGAAPEGK